MSARYINTYVGHLAADVLCVAFGPVSSLIADVCSSAAAISLPIT